MRGVHQTGDLCGPEEHQLALCYDHAWGGVAVACDEEEASIYHNRDWGGRVNDRRGRHFHGPSWHQNEADAYDLLWTWAWGLCPDSATSNGSTQRHP